MALRPVRGVLCIEDEQTGDGRVITAGALTWADLPLPLAWLEVEQHGDLLAGGVQVGTIDAITRVGNEVQFTGNIDDENTDGAELIRRMEAGTAALGNRSGLSIDPDDWEVQIIATDQEAGEEGGGLLLVASGSGPFMDRHALVPGLRQGPRTAGPRTGGTATAVLDRPVTAAAGDPDPGDSAVLLFEDSADSILERYTRLRIRGATACAIAAFAGAYVELDGAAAADTDDAPEGDEQPADEQPEAVAAAATAAAPARLARPPADWFQVPEPEPGMTADGVATYGMPASELLVEQPDGRLGVPLVITEQGQVFGHLALWGQCHTGYPGMCIEPPDSPAAYAHFHVGEVVCADGARVPTGCLTVGCDHAAAPLLAPEARDHYAHAGLGWADVRVSDGVYGPWMAGAVRPGVNDNVLRVLRASAPSGDWRRIGGSLELIAALSVNSPGFPVAREALMASGLQQLPTVQARAHMADGVQTSLVASGLVVRCAECAQRARANGGQADVQAQLHHIGMTLERIERRTRHMVPDAAAGMLGRIRK